MASMLTIDNKVFSLRQQISLVEEELTRLRLELRDAEGQIEHHDDASENSCPTLEANIDGGTANLDQDPRWPMPLEDYKRYGRQMIMPEIGLVGQLELRKTSLLIIGLGGLGCPAAAYLAGAGVGSIGLVDGDTVEMSNLHRQILHQTRNVGMLKIDSAIKFLRELNPTIKYVPHEEHISPQNALDIISRYDLVLDCTDHPTSRYLISDACVLLRKPLISASALRTEGQLMVLNNPPGPPGDAAAGPCYRCVFPKPPPAESVTSCGEGGILGPVVGTMGVLQALEAVKMICTRSADRTAESKAENEMSPQTRGTVSPSLLLFSAYSSQPFRTVRLRSRRADCVVCSAKASITPESLTSGSFDYVQFCGVLNSLELLTGEERLSPAEYERQRSQSRSKPPRKEHILVDVREKAQFSICSLPGSVNVPFSALQSRNIPPPLQQEGSAQSLDSPFDWLTDLKPDTSIFVVCRMGNDSQVVAKRLKDAGWGNTGNRRIQDIRGGFKAWKEEVDQNWPEY
ncbi:MAG: hypothetical protein M4579_006659 [Chaenotheca gracillima]|nr:MAG: hypothetical protein M4579_006659 [Chaenotheca gracillima]